MYTWQVLCAIYGIMFTVEITERDPATTYHIYETSSARVLAVVRAATTLPPRCRRAATACVPPANHTRTQPATVCAQPATTLCAQPATPCVQPATLSA